MLQLLTHKSQDSAHVNYFYPYTFGHFTTALTWTEDRKGFGERLITRTFNPTATPAGWNKPKEHPCHDLVFLFHNSANNMLLDQCINLSQLNAEQITHIVSHYVVTPEQRERIRKHIAKNHPTVRTNWAVHESINPALPMPQAVDVPILDFPFATLLYGNCLGTSKYTHPTAPSSLTEPKPVGRPRTNGLSNPYERYREKHRKADGTDAMTTEQRALHYRALGGKGKNPDLWSDADIDRFKAIDKDFTQFV